MSAPPPTLTDAIAAIAHERPRAPWLLLPDGSVADYGLLAATIARVDSSLRERGLGRGDVIAGCTDDRVTMAYACLALPAASTYAPLSPALTADAYAELLARLGAVAALVPARHDHPLRIAAARLGIGVARLSAAGDGGGARRNLALEVSGGTRAGAARANPGHAYVHVTSGTTGRAKLVPLGHGQMLAYARSMIRWLSLSGDDVGAALAPFHFAGGLRATLLIPALAGASVVCFDESDVDAFLRALRTIPITHLSAPFAIHRAILERSDDYRDEIAASRLRFLRATAGRLDPDAAGALERLFRAPVLMGLGSSEACGIAHDPMPPAPRRRGSVGIATDNEIRVRDAAGRDLAAGETGEIVVRGPLVFDGYLDDPDLTSRSFDRGWFRTGDLGWIDTDGTLFLTGRTTEIANRGGEKISLVAVDRAAASLPGVADAAAYTIAHPTLGEDVAVALVRAPAATIDVADVVAHLRMTLGAAQAPRVVRFVAALPRTDSGKVVRRLLAGPADAPDTTDDAPASLTPVESALAGLLRQLLPSSELARDRPLRASGIDVATAGRIGDAIAYVFGTTVAPDAIAGEDATLSTLASAIEHVRANPALHPRRGTLE